MSDFRSAGFVVMLGAAPYGQHAEWASGPRSLRSSST